MHKKNAAHTILPFNTYVKVTNLNNKKYTIVRINDRGPFAKGRIIDLSYAAAKEIDMVGPGTTQVEVVALNRDQIDPGIHEGIFTVQVGSFAEQANAKRLADKLLVLYEYVNITENIDANNKRFSGFTYPKPIPLITQWRLERNLKSWGLPRHSL
jgi:rare lipoprotein A